MALTRKMLKAMGIEEEKIEQIIDAHSETVDALKKEGDNLREKAEKLADVEKELDSYKAQAEKSKNDPYKAKYEEMKKDFEAFKTDVANKESRNAKVTAYTKLLKEIGIPDKRIDAIIKVTDIDGIVLDDKGELTDSKTLSDSARNEWSDFIVTDVVKGAGIANPPMNRGNKTTMSKDEIMNIKDAGERQKAMIANPELFGI